MIAYRDIKVRYKQSIMGFMWAVLMPILIVMAGVVVRYAYALAAHTPLKTADIASVAVKSLPWAFLVSSIRFACLQPHSNNKELVTKIYFPKEIFPIAAVMASFFDLLVAPALSWSFCSCPGRLESISHLDPCAGLDYGPSGCRNRHDCICRQSVLPRREIHRRSATHVWNFFHSGFL